MSVARYVATASLLALALGGCGGGAPPDGPGARLYAMYCLACHQRDGAGVPGVQPALAGTPVPTGDPGDLLRWVMYGQRPASLPRGQFSGVMPQFAYLSDADLALLLSYVRSNFGNQAPPVTAAMVAAARAAHRTG